MSGSRRESEGTRTSEETIAILARALRWYANPENYSRDDWGVRSVIAIPDYGEPGGKARRALKRAGLGS